MYSDVDTLVRQLLAELSNEVSSRVATEAWRLCVVLSPFLGGKVVHSGVAIIGPADPSLWFE